jgi:AraC-like DNA-binding protein
LTISEKLARHSSLDDNIDCFNAIKVTNLRRPMIFQTHIPRFPLDQFIDYFIYAEGYDPEHSIDRFLPDGNTEVIFDFDDAPQYIYDNQTLKEIQACRHVWASGVRTEFISIPSGKHTAKLIISFQKGRAAPFFPFPMSEMSDRVLDADLIWGDDFALLRERLLAIKEIDFKFRALEDFLLHNYGSRLVLNPSVDYALAEIIRQPDQISLARTSRKIGYSQKHFIDLFKRQVGITPKAYLKIIRFQKAVREIERSRDVDWTIISQDCGFYDQAHFINDFKSFSGFTPAEYVRRKNGVLNYVPVG